MCPSIDYADGFSPRMDAFEKGRPEIQRRVFNKLSARRA